MKMSEDLMIFENIGCDDHIGIYNAFLHAFSIVNKKVYEYLVQSSNAESLASIYRDLSNEQVETLLNYGVLINDEKIYLSKEHRHIYTERIRNIRTAYLHVTLDCNLSCSYCYNSQLTNKTYPQLGTEHWKLVIERLHEVGVINIVFTGGEPLLYPGLLDVIEFAKSLKLKVTLLTNGTLLRNNLDIFEMVDASIISLDGVSASRRKGIEQHDVLNGILNISEMYSKKITVRSVVSRGFESEVASLKALLEKNGIKHIQTLHIPYKPEDIKSIPDYDKFSLYDESFISPDFCGAGDGIVAIGVNGDIFPCQTMIKPELCIANIFEKDWLIKYRNDNVCAKIRIFKTSQNDLCRPCVAKHFCNGGCRAIAHNVYRDMTKPNEFLCDYYKKCAKVTIQKYFERELIRG